ncbi:retrotransposon protein, putative, ty1-copia subclass [Tanacetum coccineum]
MTKKPFNNNIEKATDLLGLIHTDVCGPFRHVSRKGASYFLTFTDDFSHYGYVYLLKHKHEVFETFKDYLGKNGIVQHLTSPYTPQQNGLSERRNHTLLDMVRSMFNLITLPLSFWDYALESAIRILNMVYKILRLIRTPYGLWLATVIWQGAMDEEMNSMKVNEVWIEVVPPPNAKVVRSKWLFKKKTDMDGEVHTYKARLVAKGCTQTYGIDYEETFSPVADIRAIRILIAIAAYYDYEIWQMDVKTAFLNGRLDEDIYMKQPEGYVNPKYPKRVCKLQRSIYGLKQASRQWNKRFDEEIKKFGFTQNRDEPCGLLCDDVSMHKASCGVCSKLGQSLSTESREAPRGFVFVVNGGAVGLEVPKKQTTYALSATQAEYMAASEAAMEAVWIRKFVGDLGVMPSIKKPINMYCDNSVAIIFANDSGVMKGARHFLRRYHYVREQVESGEIKILKVHTDDNLADPFTKALPRGKVTDHANGIGLQLASSFMHTCD